MATKKSTKKLSFRKTSPLKMLLAVVVVTAVAGIGTYLLTRSNAATVGPHMYMAASNNTQEATFTQFDFGIFGDKYVAGDWDGNGTDTLGVYRPSESTFYLTNSNSSAGVPGFGFGNSGDIPIAGDWNGDGTTTVGVYRPTTGKFYLRNSNNTNTTGIADVETLMLGNLSSTTPDKVPIACDWNGDGITDLGLFRTSTAEWETFVSYGQQVGAPWIGYVATFKYGSPNDKPVCGDWNSDKTATPGVYRDSNSTFYLKNTNDGAAGYPQPFGLLGWLPLVGRWTGTAQTLIGAYSVGTVATTPCEATGMDVKGTENLKRLQLCINSLIKDGGKPLTPDGILGAYTKVACIKYMGGLCPVYVRDYVVPAGPPESQSGLDAKQQIVDPNIKVLWDATNVIYASIIDPASTQNSTVIKSSENPRQYCRALNNRIMAVVINATTLRTIFDDSVPIFEAGWNGAIKNNWTVSINTLVGLAKDAKTEKPCDNPSITNTQMIKNNQTKLETARFERSEFKKYADIIYKNLKAGIHEQFNN